MIEHFAVHAGMEVVDADRALIGHVAEVRESTFTMTPLTGDPVTLPFGAMGEVTDDQVVLTLTMDHLATIARSRPAEGPSETPVDDAPIAL